MYTGPDPQCLAPARCLETGQECPVFRHANLATLPIHDSTLHAVTFRELQMYYYVISQSLGTHGGPTTPA